MASRFLSFLILLAIPATQLATAPPAHAQVQAPQIQSHDALDRLIEFDFCAKTGTCQQAPGLPGGGATETPRRFYILQNEPSSPTNPWSYGFVDPGSERLTAHADALLSILQGLAPSPEAVQFYLVTEKGSTLDKIEARTRAILVYLQTLGLLKP